MAITGTYSRSLDEKLRLAVPTKFREALFQGEMPALYLAPESDRSLGLFGSQTFERRAARLAEASGPSGHLRNYMRLYYSQAEQVEIDSQGRIRVPERLAEFAGLKQDVVLLGVHDHVEVWDKLSWDLFVSAHSGDFDRLANEAWE